MDSLPSSAADLKPLFASIADAEHEPPASPDSLSSSDAPPLDPLAAMSYSVLITEQPERNLLLPQIVLQNLQVLQDLTDGVQVYVDRYDQMWQASWLRSTWIARRLYRDSYEVTQECITKTLDSAKTIIEDAATHFDSRKKAYLITARDIRDTIGPALDNLSRLHALYLTAQKTAAAERFEQIQAESKPLVSSLPTLQAISPETSDEGAASTSEPPSAGSPPPGPPARPAMPSNLGMALQAALEQRQQHVANGTGLLSLARHPRERITTAGQGHSVTADDLLGVQLRSVLESSLILDDVREEEEPEFVRRRREILRKTTPDNPLAILALRMPSDSGTQPDSAGSSSDSLSPDSGLSDEWAYAGPPPLPDTTTVSSSSLPSSLPFIAESAEARDARLAHAKMVHGLMAGNSRFQGMAPAMHSSDSADSGSWSSCS